MFAREDSAVAQRLPASVTTAAAMPKSSARLEGNADGSATHRVLIDSRWTRCYSPRALPAAARGSRRAGGQNGEGTSVRSLRWLVLMLVPLLALLGACGGGGDDDDGDDDDSGDTSSQDKDASPTKNSSTKSDDKRPELKAGTYSKGKVRVEITGERKETIDAEGNAFVTDEVGLLSYADDKVGVILSIGGEGSDEAGGLSITTGDFATAGEWGKECKLSVDQSGSSLKGTFSCDKIKAISLTAAKDYDIKIKGTFTAEP